MKEVESAAVSVVEGVVKGTSQRYPIGRPALLAVPLGFDV